MIRLERIPGPMPYALRAQLTRDNQQDADTAARAVMHYTAAELAHTARSWRLPQGSAARRSHLRAVLMLRAALADELDELAPPKEPTR